jgi:hypothetical protein
MRSILSAGQGAALAFFNFGIVKNRLPYGPHYGDVGDQE